jgi:hypothetical protein
MDRTIEQILGIHPMNQMDTAATPMYGAFTDRPDFTPYNVVQNQTSLTLGYATEPSCGWNVPAAVNTAYAAPPTGKVPPAEASVAAAWARWQAQQHFTGPHAIEDYPNDVTFNHWDWYQAHDWKVPYPGESKIYPPQDVPGGSLSPQGGDS